MAHKIKYPYEKLIQSAHDASRTKCMGRLDRPAANTWWFSKLYVKPVRSAISKG